MLDYSKLFDAVRNSYAYASYHRRSGKALMPLRYFFELTYRCNLNCPYCYVGANRTKDELSTEEWKKVIRQIPFYSIVTLVGGEPLIRQDFAEILEAVSKRTFSKVNLVTNGILINDELIDLFIKNKLLLLSVSLDGYEKNHDINRNREGIFDKIYNNLEKIAQRKKHPLVDIKTIILPNNLDDMVDLYKMCDKFNFDFFSVSFLRNNNLKQNSVLQNSFIPEYNMDYPIELYFDIDHFKEVFKEINSLSKKSNVKLRFAPKFEQFENYIDKIEEFFTNPQKSVNEIYKPCLFPFSNTFITPCGDIYPCLSMKIGNVRENTIKNIFNMPNYRCFRKNLKAQGVFSACQMCCELSVK